MGDQLTNATENLKSKHNFANLKEEYDYVNAANEAIETLEGSGGGVTEQFVTDAIQVETDARTTADETLQDNIDIAIATLAPKRGLYKDDTTPINLETQCQSLEARVATLETPASKQATLSPEQIKELETSILSELLKKVTK